MDYLGDEKCNVCGEFPGFPFCSHISRTWPAGASTQNCQQVPTTTTEPPKTKKNKEKPQNTLEKSLLLLTEGLRKGDLSTGNLSGSTPTSLHTLIQIPMETIFSHYTLLPIGIELLSLYLVVSVGQAGSWSLTPHSVESCVHRFLCQDPQAGSSIKLNLQPYLATKRINKVIRGRAGQAGLLFPHSTISRAQWGDDPLPLTNTNKAERGGVAIGLVSLQFPLSLSLVSVGPSERLSLCSYHVIARQRESALCSPATPAMVLALHGELITSK